MERKQVTRRLLGCGAVAGPLFLVVVLVQDYTRPGVNPREQPLSLLTLGALGWIQVTNFVVTGLLNVAFAVGIRMALRSGPGGTWGPLLIGGFGLGLIAAGAFVPDPAFGFPPGAPPGMPSDISWHANLHSVAALVVFGSLIPAIVAFTRRFVLRREWVWALASALTGAAVLAFFLSTANEDLTSLSLRAAAALGWGWTAALAVHLRHTTTSDPEGKPDEVLSRQP
ncbi:DUF998 domain-containing protein [Amycolatopsis lexingtonensis]|uniref:DUF998 domain-containing protein n=1 Tax=Amycolatopsis lexingtonensis TaxID=218822 RepID=UPI003F707D01